MRDRHQVVVDDVGEVVGRQAVALHEHLIVDLAGLERDVPPHDVLEADCLAPRHFEPDDMRLAPLQPLPDVAFGQGECVFHLGPRRGVVAGRGRAFALQPLAHGVQLLGRVEGVVGVAGFEKLLRVVPVDVLPPGLVIRRVLAFFLRPFIVGESGPGQRTEDVFLGLFHIPALVGVFDAEHERAAVLPSKKVVVQGRPQPADVEQPGWARGETDTDRGSLDVGHGVQSKVELGEF